MNIIEIILPELVKTAKALPHVTIIISAYNDDGQPMIVEIKRDLGIGPNIYRTTIGAKYPRVILTLHGITVTYLNSSGRGQFWSHSWEEPEVLEKIATYMNQINDNSVTLTR